MHVNATAGQILPHFPETKPSKCGREIPFARSTVKSDSSIKNILNLRFS
jgi:hypothetical protein